MNQKIIQHLFDFWEYIGSSGNFSYKEQGIQHTSPRDRSWPSKAFGIDNDSVDYKALFQKMKNSSLPNSLGVAESNPAERVLVSHGFKRASIVKAMSMNIANITRPVDQFSNIIQVETEEHANYFARIASKAFGYNVQYSTIAPLLKSSVIRIYIGHFENNFVSGGMLYLDKEGNSGIHMIGTLPSHRGLGLGKDMTQKLLQEAFANKSENIFLVASKAGERIYSRIGFISHGTLISYAA